MEQGVRGATLADRGDSLEMAARLYFNGLYDASADMALRLRDFAPEDLAAYEQRTSALHFQLKRELAAISIRIRDRKRALRECRRCQELADIIKVDVADGRAIAHARLKANPKDVDALFYLGKLNLTYVWLHNDTLGQRAGIGEYREARRVLDDVLELEPDHVRARIARAFIDHAIDTRVPWAFRWVLGGGDKEGALSTVRETATLPAAPMVRAEAEFALWEMLTKANQMGDAEAVARSLSAEFPQNRELQRFLDARRN